MVLLKRNKKSLQTYINVAHASATAQYTQRNSIGQQCSSTALCRRYCLYQYSQFGPAPTKALYEHTTVFYVAFKKNTEATGHAKMYAKGCINPKSLAWMILIRCGMELQHAVWVLCRLTKSVGRQRSFSKSALHPPCVKGPINTQGQNTLHREHNSTRRRPSYWHSLTKSYTS